MRGWLVFISGRLVQYLLVMLASVALAFLLMKLAPGNAAEASLGLYDSGGLGSQISQDITDQAVRDLGLDIPIFYVSLSSWPEYKLGKLTSHRLPSIAFDWAHRYGCVTEVGQFFTLVAKAKEEGEISHNTWNQLNRSYDLEVAAQLLEDQVPSDKWRSLLVDQLKEIEANSNWWSKLIPVISFHSDNQLHRWLFGTTGGSSGILRGDLGRSLISGQDIKTLVGSRIKWSAFFAFGSISIALVFSLILGTEAAIRQGSILDKMSGTLTLLLFSTPTFWMSTALLMIFANPDVFGWLSPSGVGPAVNSAEAGPLERIRQSLPYLILPMVAYLYGSAAYLFRVQRDSVQVEINKAYILAARAKGLSKRLAIYKHAFRNSLFPVITLLANVFPATVAGSIIVESIFTIPGMGLETRIASMNGDFPLIGAVVLLTALASVTGFLISDLLYAWINPKARMAA